MDISMIFTIIIIALFLWFIYSRIKPVQGLRILNAREFQSEMAQNRMVIDVREPAEYKSGFIADAANIPLSQLRGRLQEIPPNQPLLLYCQSGMRSKTAAQILRKNGCQDLAHLQGGLGGWNGKLIRK